MNTPNADINQEQEEKPKLDGFSHRDIMRMVTTIAIGGTAIIFIAYFIYWCHFNEWKLGATALQIHQAAWGQFGDFIGGTVNPILGFFSLITLVLTLTLQSQQLENSRKALANSYRELELSREELRLTRAELERSAEAQELQEKALRAQAGASEMTAKLSAINTLLESLEAQKNRYGPMPSGNAAKIVGEIQKKQAVLGGILNDIYEEITGQPGDGEQESKQR